MEGATWTLEMLRATRPFGQHAVLKETNQNGKELDNRQ